MEKTNAKDYYGYGISIMAFDRIKELPTTFLDEVNGTTANNLSNMFNGLKGLRYCPKLDIKLEDNNSTINMFANCICLESVDISWIDFSKVWFTGSMFKHCMSLKTLDFSKVNTSMVRDMSYMFYGCKNLTTINGIIDMGNCTNAYAMFKFTNKLKGVHLKNVRKELLKTIGGKEGETYIIHNLIM